MLAILRPMLLVGAPFLARHPQCGSRERLQVRQMMDYTVSSAMRWQTLYVGEERAPVLVIDDLLENAAALVDAAEDAHFIDVGSIYPGVRAPAPPLYGKWILGVAAPLLRDCFGGVPKYDFDLLAYSMVVTAPDALMPSQTIPHFDGPEPNRLAFLHYLFSGDLGGTSFYRHRSTSVERVTTDNIEAYTAVCERELQQAGTSRGNYMRGDSDFFVRTAAVEAQFNRAVFYWGSLLHSGDVPFPERLTEDVRTGRLTINGFAMID